MAKRQTVYDPLSCIPSVPVIEQRLLDAERESRRLRVLLETAKAIENEGRLPDGAVPAPIDANSLAAREAVGMVPTPAAGSSFSPA